MSRDPRKATDLIDGDRIETKRLLTNDSAIDGFSRSDGGQASLILLLDFLDFVFSYFHIGESYFTGLNDWGSGFVIKIRVVL